MLKLEDVRGLFSHEFFFSHPLYCCPFCVLDEISQVFPPKPKPGRFSQWRLLAKALMTPRSKSMNPNQRCLVHGDHHHHHYIYIYTIIHNIYIYQLMMISEDIFHYLDSLAIQRIYPVWFLPKLRRRRLCLKSGARPSMDDAFFCFLACLPRVPSPAGLRWPWPCPGNPWAAKNHC